MPFTARITLLFALLSGLFLTTLLAAANPSAPPMTIHLRRGAFDPLRALPAGSADRSATSRSRLALVQLNAAPDAQTRANLEAADLRPLAYIPDNTFLVRLPSTRAVAALPGLRWSGPFAVAYKLPPALDQFLGDPDAAPVELRLLAAPDADIAAIERDLTALGGTVLGRGASLSGPLLHVRLAATTLRTALERDDVLWVERFARPTPLNDRARRILGVDQTRQQLGLDGAGQVVAVTDTGLDMQTAVLANANPDFPAARIVRGFAPREMHPGCVDRQWDDQHGHGTHVAGSILGSGARSPDGLSFAGVAPGARLVVQSGGSDLTCLDVLNNTYLATAYDAGARVQNASWGDPSVLGVYDGLAQSIDDFVWSHQDHLVVVAAGNSGRDGDQDGVIDPDSITTPATAKNVLSVGASENDRPAAGGCSYGAPEARCWNAYGFYAAPFTSDKVSDDVDGIAAFSSRGPSDDGRIKPEIVAPGVNVISARSHDPSAYYYDGYNADYAYDSGTSMAAPMVSGLAALVRQWLARDRGIDAPSAALVKALLLNGAANRAPGQYGVGAQREIPATWPNNVEGWGRATLTDTVGLDAAQPIWLHEDAGLETGASASYTVTTDGSRPLRVTLAWTDYPAAAFAGKTLVNDLDLEVVQPDGAIVHGNASAALPAACRDQGADRCDNVESVEIGGPAAGSYVVRVRGAVVPNGPQPFALVVRAGRGASPRSPGPTTLQPIKSSGPALTLTWGAVAGAAFYQVEQSNRADFATIHVTQLVVGTTLTTVEEVGSYYFRVRACNPAGCGMFSPAQPAQVTQPPRKIFLPPIQR